MVDHNTSDANNSTYANKGIANVTAGVDRDNVRGNNHDWLSRNERGGSRHVGGRWLSAGI